MRGFIQGSIPFHIILKMHILLQDLEEAEERTGNAENVLSKVRSAGRSGSAARAVAE